MSNDMMELISGYDSYAVASELNAASTSDAPATTWWCVAGSIVGSLHTYSISC